MHYEGCCAGRCACLYLLLFLLVALFPSPAVAGDNVEYGLEAGIAWTDFVGEIVTGQERITNYSIGGVVFRQLTGAVALGTGLSYARRGAVEPAVVPAGWDGTPIWLVEVNATHSMHYLEVPVVFRLTVPVGSKRLRPHVFLGSMLGVNIKSETSLEPVSEFGRTVFENAEVEKEIDLQGGRDTDASLTAGCGLRFSHGRGAFTLNFRYTHGVTPQGETESDVSFGFALSDVSFQSSQIQPLYQTGGARKHRALTASIGYLF